MLQHTFRAMDTEIEIAIARPRRHAAAAVAAVEALFRRRERALTRFSSESELGALNRAAGVPFQASPLLFATVAAAIAAARETGGSFDPTLLDALIAAGYDRTFAEVPFASQEPGPPPMLRRTEAWRRVELDPETRLITLPPCVRLDLGGIAKGLAVDAAAVLLEDAGDGFFVNAGGDLLARGMAEGSPWVIGVQNPYDPEQDVALMTLRDAAVATSSLMRRRWLRQDGEHHHLIDPRTGRSAVTDLVAASVVAATAARADVLAKVALLLGRDQGAAALERAGAAALLVGRDGHVTWSAGFPLLRDEGAPPAA